MSIYSIAKIEAEARAATLQHSDINAACPYPFGSTAGHIFKEAFLKERQAQEDAIQESAAADIQANLHAIKAVTDWSAA